MNEPEMREFIDLQRSKIRAMEAEREKDLKEMQEAFVELLKELGADANTLKEIGPMCAFNINATRLQIKERNVHGSYGWYRWNGLKARGEK